MKAETLVKLGLQEKEAQVYLALLEMGNTSAPALAKKIDIPKSTIYEIFKSLIKRGLVKSYVRNSRKRYAVTNPGVFVEKARLKYDLAQDVAPELQAMYGDFSIHKPEVQFYRGKNGVKMVLDEILNESREIISVSSIHDIFDKLHEYFPEFSKNRANKGIPIRIISRDSAMARERKKIGEKDLRQIKIKQTTIPFSSLSYVWGDKVAMITLQEDLSVVVLESKDIAQTYKALFEWIWEG